MTKLIKVKTAELTGAALDWAVGQTEDFQVSVAELNRSVWVRITASRRFGERYKPSTNWAQGGPLVDAFVPYFNVGNGQIRCSVNDTVQFGATYLIAFCRALVAAKLGDEVDVPAELAGGAA